MLDAEAASDKLLSEAEIRAVLDKGLGKKYSGKKVLVLIPDHTRTMPLPQLFRLMVEVLGDASKLDFMVIVDVIDFVGQHDYIFLVSHN